MMDDVSINGAQEIKEKTLDWWRVSTYNLRQAKKNPETEEYSVAAFLGRCLRLNKVSTILY
jgi:hypothetical protein